MREKPCQLSSQLPDILLVLQTRLLLVLGALLDMPYHQLFHAYSHTPSPYIRLFYRLTRLTFGPDILANYTFVRFVTDLIPPHSTSRYVRALRSLPSSREFGTLHAPGRSLVARDDFNDPKPILCIDLCIVRCSSRVQSWFPPQ